MEDKKNHGNRNQELSMTFPSSWDSDVSGSQLNLRLLPRSEIITKSAFITPNKNFFSLFTNLNSVETKKLEVRKEITKMKSEKWREIKIKRRIFKFRRRFKYQEELTELTFSWTHSTWVWCWLTLWAFKWPSQPYWVSECVRLNCYLF